MASERYYPMFLKSQKKGILNWTHEQWQFYGEFESGTNLEPPKRVFYGSNPWSRATDLFCKSWAFMKTFF
jgi:hypothetical protein